MALTRRRLRLGPERRRGTLGTFAGVFTPSVLTILGIILFLRLGYVVGSAGLGRALTIIGLAVALVALTSMSLSTVATNMTVKGGGDYYLISRTLGVEFGGAIGIVLVLAESVSIAMYCVGFGEVVSGMLPWRGAMGARAMALLAVAFLFVLAWLGADWATRFQYVVMAVLGAALGSFFVGALGNWDAARLAYNWAAPRGGPRFWEIFAVFFPAVTGFTQGVNMSGDLKDPGRSIPRGTFAAVAVSTLVYLCAAVAFAGALPGEVLRHDYAAMQHVARLGALVQAGVMAAALSSGMASFLGAPRVLQSMARDRVFPVLAPFAAGAGRAANPRRAVLLAGAIATVAVAVGGGLNFIAPVVSMFFLVLYGLLNYATFSEARAASPSFRPRFRWFDARLSLVGALGCLGVMVAINPAAGALSVAVLFAIYQYLKRTAGPARWADSSRSYHFQRAREHLHAMAAELEHPRDWRPQLLAFSNDSARREQLLRFASWVEGGSGITAAVQIIEGGGGGARRAKAEEELVRDIERSGTRAFPLVVEGPSLAVTAPILVQAFGVGPIRANTVLLNWREEAPGARGAQAGERRYGRYLRQAVRLGCNVVVLAAQEEGWARLEELAAEERRIDVWWRDDATGRLMLLLAYLMTRGEQWHAATIRILAAASSAKAVGGVTARLRRMLEDIRIDAEVEVVPGLDGERVAELAASSAIVFVPMRLRGDVPRDPLGEPLEETLGRLPVAAAVLAAEDIVLDAEPDEGEPAKIAAAEDAAVEAEARAKEAEKEAARLAREKERKERELEALGEEAPADRRAAAQSEAREAAAAAASAARRAARARARAEAAAEEAEKVGARPAKDRDKDKGRAKEKDEGEPRAQAPKRKEGSGS